MMNITLLGTGGTMPLKNRWLSSCLIACNGHSILTDCGEGTQIALRWAGQKSKPIDVMCFTHFHADHISGLPGFLLTMSNEGRTEPLTMVGPVGLEKYVRALCLIAPNLTFDIRFIEVKEDDKEIVTENIVIYPFRVRHSIPCLGYRFELHRAGKFDKEKAIANQVPLKLWAVLQKEQTVEHEGIIYTPDMVLGEARKGLKVTYTTDTRPTPGIINNACGSDLLICEGMFAEEDKLSRAVETGHMLFREAAQIAKEAAVRRLWLTHYSPSLDKPEEGLSAAAAIFPAAECGFDGKNIELRFEE